MADRNESRPLPRNEYFVGLNRWLILPCAVEWVCKWAVYWIRRWAWVEVLGLISLMAAMVGLVNYACEAPARRDQQIQSALQIVSTPGGSFEAGTVRRKALQRLAEFAVNLDRLDLFQARLAGAELSGVSLLESTMRRARLDNANLSYADLRMADLSGAGGTGVDLTGANLQGADLRRAAFTSTELSGADLRGADLSGAWIIESSLVGADLREGFYQRPLGVGVFKKTAAYRNTDLTGTYLAWTDLFGADLRGVRGLTCEQLQQTKNWEKALRCASLTCGGEIPTPPPIPPEQIIPNADGTVTPITFDPDCVGDDREAAAGSKGDTSPRSPGESSASGPTARDVLGPEPREATP